MLFAVSGEEIVDPWTMPRVHANVAAFDQLAAGFGTTVPHSGGAGQFARLGPVGHYAIPSWLCQWAASRKQAGRQLLSFKCRPSLMC